MKKKKDSWNRKRYKIDGIPVTPRELIREARVIDEQFDNAFLQQTSVAANILRKYGYKVQKNKEEYKRS